jgi:hypothetical protein
VLVALARHPHEGDEVEAAHERGRLRGERAQARVFDLPAAGHLLHHELRVHPHLDLGRAELDRGAQTGEQSRVLGDVVGRDTQRVGPLGEHLAGVGFAHHRAVSGRPGVAPRSPVGLDDDPKLAHSISWLARSCDAGRAVFLRRTEPPTSSAGRLRPDAAAPTRSLTGRTPPCAP